MNRRDRRNLAKSKGDPARMFERQISQRGGGGSLSQRTNAIRAAQEIADAHDQDVDDDDN